MAKGLPQAGWVPHGSPTELERSVRRELRRSFLRDASSSVGPLLAITVGLALVPLRGTGTRPVVFAVLLVVTVAAAGLGGVPAGGTTAVAAAFVFDFSHVAPYDALTLPSLLRTSATLAIAVVLVGHRAAALERDGRA